MKESDQRLLTSLELLEALLEETPTTMVGAKVCRLARKRLTELILFSLEECHAVPEKQHSPFSTDGENSQKP